MSITNRDKVFDVNDSEYGYTVSTFRPVASGSKINLYVPKIMGAITDTGIGTIAINGLFANDKSCKPTFATKVLRSKSFAVTLKDNCNWLDKVNGSGVVPSGTMFTVEFLNGSIAEPYATTK